LLPALLSDLPVASSNQIAQESSESPTELVELIEIRVAAIADQILRTVRENESQVAEAILHFQRWMLDGAIVRFLGAGRARLAAAIPANRLAHGGARVFLQDSMVPMPHSIRGGGLVAASASGKTEAVLEVMRAARQKTRDVTIVGVAAADATRFKDLCHVFIGIAPPAEDAVNPLRALADAEEYVLSEVLDALVVAAGMRAGFSERQWRLGHEDLGATGPYDVPVPGL